MHIAIVFQNTVVSKTTQDKERFTQAVNKIGAQISFLYEREFVVDQHANLSYPDITLSDIDAFIMRPSFIEEPSLHEYVPNLLKKKGFVVLNGVSANLAKNKILQHQFLAENKLPIPESYIVDTSKNALNAAKKIGYPIVAKVAFGTWGKGVFIAQDEYTLNSIVDYLSIRDGNPVIIQRFIDEAEHKDVRIFMVGNEIVSAMQRSAPEGDFRANTSSGGAGTKISLTEDEKTLAKQIQQLSKYEILGIDLIRSKDGPLVLEFNANPGFKELESVTNQDIALKIVTLAEKMFNEKTSA